MNLFMRFYEPTGGSILINGVDSLEMTRRAVHEQFGMVLQDTWLFEGTVRENLLFNTGGISENQMKDACRACGIHTFIRAYGTVLSDQTAI